MYNSIEEVDDLDQLRSRYEVLAKLGVDGEAVVHAVRCRSTNRHFAVKVMPADRQRLKKGALSPWQAHTVQALDHPNVMVLRAVHHLQGGSVAVAMERRRGQTLEELLQSSGPLPPAEAEAILREVMAAVGYLHGRGVAHGAIRPSSIFLDRDSGCARLALFGIDRGSGSEVTDLSLMKARAYLAPEQRPSGGKAQGEPGQSADLYSLGLVALAMLAGAEKWANSEREAAGKHSEPLLLLDELRSELPPSLAAGLEGCLAVGPRKRAKGIQEVRETLDGLAAEEAFAPGGRERPKLELGGRFSSMALPSRARVAWIVLAASLALYAFASGSPQPTPPVIVTGAESGQVREVARVEEMERAPTYTLPAVVVRLSEEVRAARAADRAPAPPRAPPASSAGTRRGPRLLGVPVREERVGLLGDVVIR